MFNIQFDLTQLLAVAQHIWDHNQSITQWPSRPQSVEDVVSAIIDHATQTARRNLSAPADQWTTWSGCGGYVLLLTTEDDNVVDVDILLDASIGKQQHYVQMAVEL